MADERLLIQLSAYLDGELDPAGRAAIKAALEKNPELRAFVTQSEKLERSAANLPVPSIDDAQRFRALAGRTSGRNRSVETRLKRAVAATPAPHLAPEKFDRVWENVLGRTLSPSQTDLDAMQRSAQFDGEGGPQPAAGAEERAWRRLDDAVAQLAVPRVPEVAWSETFHAIAQKTVRLSSAERRGVSRLEEAAASLKSPQMSEEATAKAWQNIAARTVGLKAKPASSETQRMDGEPAVPAVSDKQWQGVWSGIEKRIEKKPAAKPASAPVLIPAPKVEPVSPPQPATPNVVQAQTQFAASRRGKWHPWRWAAIGTLAAGVVAAFLISHITPPPKNPEAPVALEVPEVLDNRYRVVVKYVEGQAEPVLCFELKKDAQRADPEK